MVEINERELNNLQRKADERDSVHHWVGFSAKILGGLTAGIVALVFLFGYINPKINLYKANTEKKSVIAEQESKSQAAVYAAEKRVQEATAEAEARIIEAGAIAESNRIIAESLTPEYLQWRYYEVLATTDNAVIYVPVDGEVPVTEAGRAVVPTTEGG